MKAINNHTDSERYKTIIIALAELGYEQEDAKYFLNTLLESAFDAGAQSEQQSTPSIVGESIGTDGPDFWDWLDNKVGGKKDVPQRKNSLQWVEAQIKRMTLNLEKGGGEKYKIATNARVAILKQLIDHIKAKPHYVKYS